jgi:hypothetical protein
MEWGGWVGGGYGGKVCSRVVGKGRRRVMSGEGRYGSLGVRSVGVRSGEVVEVGVELLLLLFRGCSGCGVCGEVALGWGVRVMGGRGLVGRKGILMRGWLGGWLYIC